MASKDPSSLIESVPFTEMERQALLIHLASPGATWASSVRAAGYALPTGSSASHIKKRIESKLGDALIQLQVGDFELAKTIADALQAEKVLISNIRTYADGKVISERVEKTVVPDWPVRLKAADMIMKTGRGYFVPQKVNFKGHMSHGLDENTIDRLEQRSTPVEAEFEVKNEQPN